MSAEFDRVRSRAVDFAVAELARNVQEIGGENRGGRIETYMRASFASPSRDPNVAGRDWCGMFIYWCYMQAAREQGIRLPFRPDEHLWSGEKVVRWSLSHPSAIVNFSSANSGGAVVQRGDIYVAQNYHIGMAVENSPDGRSFRSIDGNQSTANSGRASITSSNLHLIVNCRLIVRI